MASPASRGAGPGRGRRRAPRGALAALAALGSICALAAGTAGAATAAVPTLAAGPPTGTALVDSAPPASPLRAAGAPADPYALTPKVAHVARLVTSTRALAGPGTGRTVMKVSPLAEWGGGEVQFLVLRSAERDGQRWLQVRLPERPNSSSGWIRANLTRISTTPWRIHVETRAARVTVERAGRVVRKFAAVVGKPSTPTPRGLFAIDEPIRQPPGSELGPWALFLTAHSRVLDDFGGGPGRIAIHGRAGPLLADPLGSHASHGCIRVANHNVRWLERIAVNGTPVLVTR